jgi:hypothetical protein
VGKVGIALRTFGFRLFCLCGGTFPVGKVGSDCSLSACPSFAACGGTFPRGKVGGRMLRRTRNNKGDGGAGDNGGARGAGPVVLHGKSGGGGAKFVDAAGLTLIR